MLRGAVSIVFVKMAISVTQVKAEILVISTKKKKKNHRVVREWCSHQKHLFHFTSKDCHSISGYHSQDHCKENLFTI